MVYSYDSEYASLLYKKCKDENDNEYIKIISGNVNGDFLNIPSTIDEIPVVEIENAAFLQGKFKYITLSQNLKFIRHSAFGNCSYLEEITFPDSLLCIEENAFKSCVRLKEVNFNNGLQEIGSSAFSYSGIEEAILPDSLTIIGESLFTHSNLRNVRLGKDVQIICPYAFYGCENLEKIDLPEGLLSIGRGAFVDSAISEITLPDSLGDLGQSVFEDNVLLKSIHIGKNLTNSPSVFEFAYTCPELKKITVSPENPVLKVINGALFNTKCKSIVRVPPKTDTNVITIPNWVKTIATFCFQDVTNKKIIFKSSSIDDLYDADIGKTNIIACSRGSDIENWALSEGLKTISTESQISTFINDIKEDVKGK